MKIKDLIIVLLIIIIIALTGILISQIIKTNESNEPNQIEENSDVNKDNSNSDNNSGKETNDNTTNKDDNKYSLLGKYVITYTDKTPKDYLGNTPSELTLNEDNTFNFKFNNCEGMVDITGTYEINGNTFTLIDTFDYSGNKKEPTFTIVSNDEFYLNETFACIQMTYDDYEKGYGSFKKVD